MGNFPLVATLRLQERTYYVRALLHNMFFSFLKFFSKNLLTNDILDNIIGAMSNFAKGEVSLFAGLRTLKISRYREVFKR